MLLILATISTAQGAWNAVHRSQDFQWSGDRILLAHHDPWAEYLQGDPEHLVLMTQVPNYTPILYVLLAPIGLLPILPAKIAWMICNFFFATISGVLAARFYGMRGPSIVAIVCLFLMATPVRNSFGNGQQGLLVLLILCVTLLSPRLTDARAAGAGLSYFKFNFAPPVFLYLLLRGGVRAVLMSAIPSIAATLAVWLWLTGGRDPHEIVKLILEPLQVSQTGYTVSGGAANLMDVLEKVLRLFQTPKPFLTPITFAVAFFICLAVLYCAIKRNPGSSVQWQMALMATMSFCLFKHHSYDAGVLLLPFCYALRLRHHLSAQIILLILINSWYLQRILDAAHIIVPQADAVHCALLLLALGFLYRLRTAEGEIEADGRAVPVFAPVKA
ncbi:glycosyltransferase family 87 protein [Granulicella sp. WH15]|uniref:glycosyltransferase family 87 protein n=1 Tax=Granulicella sp. WH15 TaxID=2602070 RepID=UPI0013A53D05|nr:glycosyltransferase family 87 protein [Granulicella sp. WH15]